MVSLLLAAGLTLASAGSAQADTLAVIKARGMLRCGVSTGTNGFSARGPDGAWRGLDADFCRAVATAIFSDPNRVEFIPETPPARLPALQSGAIDLLSRDTTWTLAREAQFHIEFVGVMYYDSEGLLAAADSPYARAPSLNGAHICVEPGSNQAATVLAYAGAHGWRVTTVSVTNTGQMLTALRSGTCALVAGDRSALEILRHGTATPAMFIIRPDVVTKEPLGPAARNDDGEWVNLVRAVYAVLIDADERGLTQSSARDMLNSSASPAAAAYELQTAPVGAAYGFRQDWAVAIIAAVGNYSEIFDRNLGTNSQLDFDAGPNQIWENGGLLYSPPFQ